MAKLSKQQMKLHNQAMDLVHSDKVLKRDERMFILQNFQEGFNQANSLAGAFFTPLMLSRDTCIEINSNQSVVDLCAGIGGLSFWLDRDNEVTCVELNPNYIEVGKRVNPYAKWIQMDALEYCETTTDRFVNALSNPPFGNIKTSDYKGLYTGSDFEYKIIEAASKVAEFGVFIIPQSSAPFRLSGVREYSDKMETKCKKFVDQTGIEMTPGCGVDTSIYLKEWHGVSPMCEIVTVEY